MAFSWLSFEIVSVSSRLTCQVVLPKVILELNDRNLNPLTSLPKLVLSASRRCTSYKYKLYTTKKPIEYSFYYGYSEK